MAATGQADGGARVRRRFEVRGRVQGVGFRPHVYRLATEMGLAGCVGNDTEGAFIEVEGPREQIERFRRRLHGELPPLAAISRVIESGLPATGEAGFVILPSEHAGRRRAEVTPDAATCPDCLRELFDPADRRYRYPFINCTHCGPRYSIVKTIPYDRCNTTMSVFPMCPACRKEYEDPADRRFHAQPVACPACGPRVWLADAAGKEAEGDAIRETARLLKEGRIVAIKGLGGFHLACRADQDAPVAELRRRKGREAKPLAMMVGSLEAARQIVELDDAAAAELTSPARPIVLAPKRPSARISEQVAPAAACFGVMLPYTPLHALLFAGDLPALVMTSGNPSDEPLCAENAEALARLGLIADAFLLHDRDIERRVDDSVVMALRLSDDETSSIPMRRARGFVPAPIRTIVCAARPILAVGAELKSVVCLLHDDQAILSEHLGDLTNPAAYRNFVSAIECLGRLTDLRPEAVACDLHPGYASTRYARQLGLPLTEVQHHHAHVVGCMVENGLTGEVIGVACDGTGHGTDGTVWGCEVLLADEAGFRRVAHLRPYPLPGGDAAAIETWRPAAGLIQDAYGAAWPAEAETALSRADGAAVGLARDRMAAAESRVMRTSSLGRLFDAAAFLLNVCDRNRCEAEAPMALEALAAAAEEPHPLQWELEDAPGGVVRMDPRPIVRELIELGESGERAASALGFHEAVAGMLADCVCEVVKRHGRRPVVLTGGCFANRLLVSWLWDLLRSAGLEVYSHRLAPPGDGGVALGQAVVAAARMEKGTG